ncbi:hypothetical protein FRB99_002944, partial [Tulasnella sp. 403]
IRFAPPLVISEEDLDKAIRIIEGALRDLDTVDVIPFEHEDPEHHDGEREDGPVTL